MSDRGITSDLNAALRSSLVRPFVLLKAEFDSGTVAINTHPRDIVYDGTTYVGAGPIMKVGVPLETAEVRAPTASIQLNGLDASILALSQNEPYQGRPVTAYLGVFDGTGAVIADPDVMGGGLIDVMEEEEGGDTASITMSIESELADLERARERRYTPEDQKRDYPADEGMKFMAALQDLELIWR